MSQSNQNPRFNTHLQILSARAQKADGKSSIKYNILLDSASDRSYATTKLIKCIRPPTVGKINVSFNSFSGENSSRPQLRSVYDVSIITTNGELKNLELIEVERICRPIRITEMPDDVIQKFKMVSINSPYICCSTGETEIDILIGIDQYWSIIMDTPSPIRYNNLVAQYTIFGWIISGSTLASNCTTTAPKDYNTTSTVCMNLTIPEEQLVAFWDLETVGIVTEEKRNESFLDNQIIKQFLETLEYSEELETYRVQMPWISPTARASLGNNFIHALKRLENLHRKTFANNLPLEKQYYEIFQRYFKQGIVEVVPAWEIKPHHLYNFPVFYMPHRPIIKEGASTKVRPVFDASAKTNTGVSLNDTVSSGPSLYPDLVQVIIRFRRWPIALSGDICQAFLQIQMNDVDTNAHRFLLYINDKLAHCRFKRVPFGNTSSPFLLNAVIKYHLSLFPDSTVKGELMENLFVDNLLTGADTLEEAEDIYENACRILKSGGFTLDKWSSNNGKLTEMFTAQQVCNTSQKFLGLEWLMHEDNIKFQIYMNITECQTLTKRSVLSLISSIFDPLGIISPYVLYGKILFQRVWLLGKQQKWDTPLPDTLCKDFYNWIKSGFKLKEFCCPRSYFSHSWCQTKKNAEIVVFGDASDLGYGAVAYLRTWSEEVGYQTALVAAKTRVAPVKKITLPRLELMGALLAARLATFIKESLKLTTVETYAYSDSTITLHWIKGESFRFKTFICNRVSEIQEKIPAGQWYHCPGKDNPADLASRGTLGGELINNKLWLNGPSWLNRVKIYPQTNRTVHLNLEGIDPENKINICVNVVSIDKDFQFLRFSKFTKIVNILSYILRFFNNAKNNPNKQTGPLTTAESETARETLWRLQQALYYPKDVARLKKGESLRGDSKLFKLTPYLDEKGILRIHGRLQNSNLEFGQKHPIILPNSYVALLLVRFYHEFFGHAGVDHTLTQLRKNFWIIKSRRAVKSVVKYCVACQKIDSKPCNQITAPLPQYRVIQNRPFAVVGIDYAGPLYCNKAKRKWYILLTTCGVTRAIHLELTPSQNLKDFFNSFSKFCSRRLIPEHIVSDNGQTFVGASSRMAQIYGPLAPQWTFIPPKSPWWGGWYERLVRSVKNGLKKSVGLRSLNRADLEVALLRIEAAVNDRPITRSTDKLPLRPSDFLLPHIGHMSIPQKEPDRQMLEELASSQKKAVAEVWSRWRDEYITNLPHLVSKHFTFKDIQIGDLVLINDNDHAIVKNRLMWPLGRVTQVFPGRDNLIRKVELQTQSGLITRTIQRLHKIELSVNDFETPMTTLSGRQISRKNYKY